MYVKYEDGERELYDLEKDPYEMESVHESADPALTQRLDSRLGALRGCKGESCRAAEDESSVSGGGS